jgi:hypothetical protein
MRAREFLIKEQSPDSLGNALRSLMAQSKSNQQSQTAPKDVNATQQPQGAQGTQGALAPAQASSSGAQAAPAKPGIVGSFISGLTGGKATSLGSAAKLGAAKVAGGAGLNSVKTDIQQNVADTEYAKQAGQGQSNIFGSPADANVAFKPGQKITLPNVGDITVGKVGPQGLELDTSKAPSIGVPKLTINPKDLLKK